MSNTSRLEVLPVRGSLVTFHALLDHETGKVILVDGGFMGNVVARLCRSLRFRGFGFKDVEAILLTHGHLDHTRNLAQLKRLTEAPIFAPVAERAHIEGRYPYRRLSRVCGWAEATGRRFLSYEVPEVDFWFNPYEKFSFWGGLQVVSLPGHTLGHCGFYSKRLKLLFAGDLFSNFMGFPRLPPPWLNVDGQMVRRSILVADALVPAGGGVVLNHGRDASPASHREDLARLAGQVRDGLPRFDARADSGVTHE